LILTVTQMEKPLTLHNSLIKIFFVFAFVIGLVNSSNAQSVTITNPATGSSYAAGSTISVSATTSGFIHAINNVTFTLSTLSSEDFTGPTYTGTFNTSTLTAGTYTLTATATDSHGNTASATISITIVPAAPTTTGGATCGGSTATLTASGGSPSGGNYNWYAASSGGASLQSTTSTTYTPTVTVTKTYYVSYSIGASESARTAVTATLSTGASSTFTAPASVNVGATSSNITYTGTDPATSTFTWNFNGGTIVTGSGEGPYTVTWASPGTYTITLTVTNTAGCSSTSTQTITVASVALGAYGFSKAIVLNTSLAGISSTLTKFPALVYIQDNALIILNNCGDKVQFPNGNGGGLAAGTNYDFAFTLPGSTTELNYQVENYDSATGTLLAWVQVPSVTNVNTNLTFYFGSLTPTHTAATAEATWTSDYLAVYHFNETPTNATVSVLDKTIDGVNGTPTNVTTATDEIHSITGTLGGTGGGYSFNGTSSKVLTTTKENITASFTLSAWVKVTTPTGDNKVVSNELDFGPGYKLSVKNGVIESETRSTNINDVTGFSDAGNLGQGGTVSASAWHYIQGVFNGSTFTNYLDGAAATTTTTPSAPTAEPIDPANGNNVTIGLDHGDGIPADDIPANKGTANDGSFFGGIMDEVRISNVVKSADWIKCEYYNQSNPVTFTNNTGAITAYQPNAPALVGALTYTWVGLDSTSPTNPMLADNWDIGLTPTFNGNTKLSIPVVSSNVYPVLNANESVYELTIANGATFNLGGYTLSVGCNIYNNATTAGTGILNAGSTASGITWDGSLSAQSYTGTNNPTTAEVGNMTVSNSSAGTITITGGPIDLFNLLTLTTGNLVINNAGSGALTLKSTAARTAAVAIIPSACSIQGLVNAERFLTGGGLFSNRGYRMLSSPVNQTQYLAATTNIIGLYYLNKHANYGTTYAGAFTAGPGGTSGGFSIYNFVPTMYLYKEPLAFSNATFTGGDHVGIDDINATGNGATGTVTTTETLSDGTTVSIPVGNGFIMYFVGSTATRTNATTATAPDDATMTANGYLNQGSIPVSLWYTPSGGAGKLSYTTPNATHPYPGFNMVGNPYPSTINLAQVITDNSASIDAIYVLSAKNSPNQLYIAYTANGASAPNENYAVSGEGFIVRATATGNKTLTFLESEKLPTGQLTGSALIMALRKPQATAPGSNLSEGPNSLAAIEPQGNTLTGLYMKMQKDTNTYNYCGIYFRKDWLAKYAEDDAQDINGTSLPVVMASLTSDGILASVNHMPDYTRGINVKLYVNANADGLYNLSIEGIRNIDTLYDIYLVDNYKKDSLDIRRYGTYAFNISKSDTSSFGGGRFELSIHPGPLPLYKLLTFTGQKVTGGVQVNWRTEAEGNYTGFVLQKLDVTPGQYNPLDSLQGNGSGAYSYIDPNPISGSNTYRLQQSDIANNISYSSPITIIYSQSGLGGAFSVYPNPAVATISVNVGNVTSGTPTYKANIYNSVGELISQKTVSGSNWTQDVTLYKPGVYIIQLIDNNGNLVGKSKFIKTN
jgi:hypothetical protein